MDKLDKMFEMQKGLNKRILGPDVERIHQEEKEKWILNYARALQQETAELIDSVPWKWWASYQKLDLQNARVEVVDMLHFLICLAQTLDMSAQDVFDAYNKKNAVNHQRQDKGYIQKEKEDSAHI